MYSLLIDTHDKDVLLVLYKDGKVQDKICKESNMRHSEITMPSLIELLEKNSVNMTIRHPLGAVFLFDFPEKKVLKIV